VCPSERAKNMWVEDGGAGSLSCSADSMLSSVTEEDGVGLQGERSPHLWTMLKSPTMTLVSGGR